MLKKIQWNNILFYLLETTIICLHMQIYNYKILNYMSNILAGICFIFKALNWSHDKSKG